MTLNEVTLKTDNNLENLCKKFEKVAMDTGTKDFVFNEDDNSKYWPLAFSPQF